MRKLLFVLLLSSGMALATPEEDLHQKAASRFLNSIGIDEFVKKSNDQMYFQTSGQEPCLHTYKQQVEAIIDKHISSDELKIRMIPYYTKVFTTDELNELSQFHETELGKKLLKEMHKMMRASFHEMMQLTNAKKEEIQKDIDAFKKTADLKNLPPECNKDWTLKAGQSPRQPMSPEAGKPPMHKKPSLQDDNPIVKGTPPTQKIPENTSVCIKQPDGSCLYQE